MVSRRVRELCREDDNGWSFQIVGPKLELAEKDGYKIYFYKNKGFELAIRNAEGLERHTVFDCIGSDVPTGSPLYLALIEYTMQNAETIASMEMNNDNS